MPNARKTARSLDTYRTKRTPGATPEPFAATAPRPRLFVIQKHAARRLHYDFRLEAGGVLLSWAVPKGPSLDPAEKRLAVRVEDHPLDYADFEGSIPEGNYGAGAVIVWDIGRWIPAEDPEQGLEAGKLLFDLQGHKLQGRWTLVRTRRRGESGREWLLIKKPDGHADPEARFPDESVLSGRTVEEVARGRSQRASAVARALARLPAAPRQRVASARVRPMLAEARDAPFSGAGWVFEPKYDGYRVIAAHEGGAARLRYRSGREATGIYPEIARALAALPVEHAVLDGELVVLDEEGRPRFQLLQQRAQLTRPRDAERGALELPAVLYAFDLLGFGDRDLRPLPLLERKRLLERLLPSRGPLRFAPHFAERGEAVFEQARRLGFEGVVAKRADSPYRAGRSSDWRKIRGHRSGDFVIVGFTAPRGERSGFGALHLARPSAEGLRYVGRVGSGFDEATLRALRTALEALRRDTPPCTGALPRARGHHWVEPRLVCEVRYAEVTADGHLRQPVFLRLREDKAPAECDEPLDPAPHADEPAIASVPSPGTPPGVPAPSVERRVPFTNLDKVFWPAEGYTKGDLIAYHRRIAPWLLPYLRDRPLVLTRYPDGIGGKSFFQKDAPAWVPDWVRTETLWSEHGGREIHYFVCDDLDALLYVVNLGTIPLHVWSSRLARLQRPDWCILDLDPKQAPFEDVVAVARAIRALCEEIGLPAFPKTSGSTGLHVLLPLGGQLTYEQSRTLGELIARVVVAELPGIATIARALRAREGRVYVDTLQNGHGRLLAAPFSARPLPGAPVSMPLRWSEVRRGLDPRRYTIRSAAARMERLGEDPLRAVLATRPDLTSVLARLAERFDRAP
jgi:bifunctional non-homologous end joining protein LigD